jgi:hypothetical protein
MSTEKQEIVFAGIFFGSFPSFLLKRSIKAMAEEGL